MAPLARLKIAEMQAVNAHANDFQHRQADGLPHFPDLPFCSLAHDHPQPGAFAGGRLKVHLCRHGAIAVFQDDGALLGWYFRRRLARALELMDIHPDGWQQTEDTIFEAEDGLRGARSESPIFYFT